MHAASLEPCAYLDMCQLPFAPTHIRFKEQFISPVYNLQTVERVSNPNVLKHSRVKLQELLACSALQEAKECHNMVLSAPDYILGARSSRWLSDLQLLVCILGHSRLLIQPVSHICLIPKLQRLILETH